jgi:Na+-translocating ferredoxin:NAD+ oxidoreductase RnfE subunit
MLHWSRLAALFPLAAIGLEVPDALLLAGVLALTLLAVDAGLLALRRVAMADQHLVIAALLAAIVTGALDLVLHAVCHAQAQVLQPYLPLPIVVAVLFGRVDATSTWLGTLRNAALRGSAFGAMLVMGAALHALLPDDARIAASLILCGLLVATVAKFAPADATPPRPRRPRARVTGPLR